MTREEKERLDRIEEKLDDLLARPVPSPQMIPMPYPVYPRPMPQPVRPWSPWDQYPRGPRYTF